MRHADERLSSILCPGYQIRVRVPKCPARGQSLNAHENGLLSTEVYLSANSLLKYIKEPLEHFGLDPRTMKIYLWEDRDADINQAK